MEKHFNYSVIAENKSVRWRFKGTKKFELGIGFIIGLHEKADNPYVLYESLVRNF